MTNENGLTIKEEIRRAQSHGYNYYVYGLFGNKENPFYIGKGKNSRCFQHEKEACKGKAVNIHKNRLIIKLKQKDVPIKIKIYSFHEEESTAYKNESFFINYFGVENLTNIERFTTREEKDRYEAGILWNKLIPYDIYIQLRGTDKYVESFYKSFKELMCAIYGFDSQVYEKIEAERFQLFLKRYQRNQR